MVTSDGAALLAGILAQPSDNLVRLAYADWLEETAQSQSQLERAEFIQVQIALHRLGPYHLSCTGDQCPDCSWLRKRQEALFSKRWREWAGDAVNSRFRATLHQRHFAGRQDGDCALVARGFVDQIRCAIPTWLEYGPAIMRGHPVSDLGAINKSPNLRAINKRPQSRPIADPITEWGWFKGVFSALWKTADPEDLPEAIWDRLEGGSEYGWWKFYPSEAAAIRALSDFLLGWAGSPKEPRPELDTFLTANG